MASSSAVARLRELTTAAELSGAGASALAECCADLLRPGGGDAEAALPALDALCAASASAAVGEAMRRHADDLAPLVVARLGDADAAVREAARRFLVALMEMKEMNARMENAEPPSCIPNVHHSHYVMIEMEPSDTNQAKKSPKEKISTREISILAGEGDMTKKSVEPIKVFSEKDLVREIEKVSSTLQPDKEWSIRLTAMQRVEGLVLGGAVEYSAFPMLLKQLVTPLITQLLDRRSSIVKQACHLLSFLSKELLRDFEPCAELLIPVLLKNVVITILVIADSADNCIKEMLQNCKVARILPRIIEFAKNDRSAVLRARCCEYAIMMLECWVDTPEIQRSADLYEELIKCCIEDATNEVRSSARACYRIFSKIWPERSCQLFSSFETSRQKMINDEDAEMHLKHSPADRTKSRQPQSSSYIPTSTGYGSQVVSAMDKVVNIDSRMLSSGVLPSLQGKPALQSDDMTLKSPVKDRRDVSSAIGNTFEDMSTLEKDRTPVEDPENCDSGVTSSSTFHLPSPALLAPEPPTEISLSDAAIITIVQDKVECRPNVEQITPQQAQAPWDPSELPNLSPPVSTKEAGNLLKKSSVKVIPMTSSSTAATLKNPVKVASDANSGRRYGTQQVKRCISSPNRGVVPKERNNNYTPNFQRPLLSKQMTNWFFASTRSDLDDKQLILGEMVSNMDVPSTLTEALSLGLNPRSDWMMRVYAFNFLQSLLQRGAKGIQEVLQNFEKVMRLVSRYLDDPHHKVAQAALSSLAEIISVFKKSFEHYLDKMLPHVFSQLNDPKESIRQQCSEILKLAGEHYSIDFLLPALLRSLDEQKSPKSKLAVLEFANASFSKCTVNSDSYSSSSFLKPWLGKLALLFKDKNNKLKEVAIGGFSLIYSHYDPASVLSFIVSLSMEEQKRLRRAMKQLIPAIDSDLEKFLQQRRQKQKMPSYDPFTAIGQPFAKGFIGKQTKPQLHPACPADSTETDDVFSSAQQCLPIISQRISFEVHEHPTGKIEFESSDESGCHKVEDMGKNSSTTRSWSSLPRTSDYNMVSENAVESPSKDTCNLKSCEESNASGLSIAIGNKEVMRNNCQEDESSVSQMQHEGIMNQRDEVPETNGHSLSIKNLHQMTSSLLEMLDDQNESAKELALSLLVEILEKQAKAMEHCVETLIVKLLYATKDAALKVVNQAHICLSTVVTQFDPQRCLGVIVSQLVCKDEKLLIISINSLSKIVIRLSQDDLMTHLSTFLPALLDAFENHSPYVRKAVVLCLVDIYLKLGPTFLPYLESLDSTQLQLVTTYANRLSQTRFIAVDV